MSNKVEMALQVLKNPYKIVKHIGGKGYLRWIPDEPYLKMCYRAAFGKKLNLENPQTFNEKIQWLKLYDHNPIYTSMVDKYEAKKYVADIIGEEYIIPTLGIWDKFDDIDFDSLPNQFVLKCTHDSGGLVICKDKSKLDKAAARKKIEKSLKRRFYYVGREWAYKDVKPRIIAEKYMEDSSAQELKDYKLMCFDGKVRCSFVCSDRFSESGVHVTFYDENWNKLPFERHYPSSEAIDKPSKYDEMIGLAEKLSEKLAFVRTDFYEIDGRLYFGELTLYPGDGFEEFTPDEWDYKIGEWMKVPGGGYTLTVGNICLWIHEEKKAESELRDYKFMCFNGKVGFTLVCEDRQTDYHITFYDTDWSILPFSRHYPRTQEPGEKPVSYDEMIKLSERLAKDMSFLRVDFYEIKGQPFFGELTLYPGDGFERFHPDEADLKVGKMLRLPGGGYLIDAPGARLYIHEDRKQLVLNQDGLTDYKFYCFNGEPKFLYVSYNLADHDNSSMSFFSIDFVELPFYRADYNRLKEPPLKPDYFEKMVQMVRGLSKGIPFVRVDLYEICGNIYFSEFTFYPCDGFMIFKPDEYDDKTGELLELPITE